MIFLNVFVLLLIRGRMSEMYKSNKLQATKAIQVSLHCMFKLLSVIFLQITLVGCSVLLSWLECVATKSLGWSKVISQALSQSLQ